MPGSVHDLPGRARPGIERTVPGRPRFATGYAISSRPEPRPRSPLSTAAAPSPAEDHKQERPCPSPQWSAGHPSRRSGGRLPAQATGILTPQRTDCSTSLPVRRRSMRRSPGRRGEDLRLARIGDSFVTESSSSRSRSLAEAAQVLLLLLCHASSLPLPVRSSPYRRPHHFWGSAPAGDSQPVIVCHVLVRQSGWRTAPGPPCSMA